jgi:hypothetical protein
MHLCIRSDTCRFRKISGMPPIPRMERQVMSIYLGVCHDLTHQGVFRSDLNPPITRKFRTFEIHTVGEYSHIILIE